MKQIKRMITHVHSHENFIHSKLLSSIACLTSYDTEIEALGAKLKAFLILAWALFSRVWRLLIWNW